jgi:hypothetical protein
MPRGTRTGSQTHAYAPSWSDAMKYAVWTAVIAASAAFAGAAAAQDDNFSLIPHPYVHPHFSNYLSPPGPEACAWPQPCWYKLQTSPAAVVVTPPTKRVVVRRAR